MHTIKLNNGIEMPSIGFGTYLLKDGKECEQCVLDALQAGYRLIDTATAYYNEESVGLAIKKSALKRENIFITTKLWISDLGFEKTKKAFDLSLKKLGVDYVDLYLIHIPKGNVNQSWKAMEELYLEGKIRAIGVSNFHTDQIHEFINKHNIIPAVNQVETHPFSQKANMQEALKKHNIRLESWAPFAQGKNNIFQNELLNNLAHKYGKTVAQIVLRWLIQRGIFAIPKSSNRLRINENMDVFNFEISKEDMESIKSLDRGKGLIYHI